MIETRRTNNGLYVEVYTRILIHVHLLVLSIKLFTSRQDITSDKTKMLRLVLLTRV